MTSETPASSPRNQILEDVWTRFARYDKNAVKAQKNYIAQRKLILTLGVAATTLAVIYSLLQSKNAVAGLPSPFNSFFDRYFLPGFHALVVLIPIISTALVAFSLKFNIGVHWIALRGSAEALKKEIYLFRMKVLDYSDEELAKKNESRDVHLARKVKVIGKRLMETQVNQTGLEDYKDSLPPLNAIARNKSGMPIDDGFSDMDAEDYVAWRLEDQFDYYYKKANRFAHDLRHFQILIILLGALGSALAALQFELWVAVSGALATALASFLEAKRVESTVIDCNKAAADLYDIRLWWHALSDDAKKESANIRTLVKSTELVIQSENAGWVQEMRETLSEIYGDKKEEDNKEHSSEPALASSDALTTFSPPEGTLSSDASTDASEAIAPESLTEAAQATVPDSSASDGSVPDGFVPDGFAPDGAIPDGVAIEQPTGETQSDAEAAATHSQSDEVSEDPETPQDLEPSVAAQL